MRRYESVVILDPDVPDDEVKGFTEKYGQIIKTHGGEIIKVEDWGPKKLAYLVRKRDKGRYILFDFVGTPALILEMERQFKISEDVMKYLSVKVDDEVDLEAFKAASKAKEAAAAEPAPAEPAPVPEAEVAPPLEAAPEVTAEEPQKPAEEAAAPATDVPEEAEAAPAAEAPEEAETASASEAPEQAEAKKEGE